MAGKKTASTKKSGTGKKVNRSNGRPASKDNTGFSFRNEVILLILLAVSVILFLGNFGLAGGPDSGGNWLSNRMRGLLGLMEYPFPIVLFVSACFCIIRRDTQTYIKTAVVYVMMLDVAAIVQLLRGKQFENLFEQGMTHIFAGGLFGGCIARMLYSVVGILGGIAILIIVLLVCVVYLTEVSFVGSVEKNGRKVYEHTKEDMKRRREEHYMAEQYRKERRLEEERQRQEEQKRLEERRYQQLKLWQEQGSGSVPQEESPLEHPKMGKHARREYVNANGMDVVTLEQPKSNKRVDESPNNVHEIFAKHTGENHPVEEDTWSNGAFTIHRDGAVSEVQVHGDEPPMITKRETQRKKPAAVKEKTRETQRPEAVEGTVTDDVTGQLQNGQTGENRPYVKPDISLLKKSVKQNTESDAELTQTGIKLQQTLQSFGVRVAVTNISCGPTVTRFELQPEQGVKVSKIVGLADDIKLNLAVEDIRIEAPIPGKAAVGIEVPNRTAGAVMFGDLMDSAEFKKSDSLLNFAVGKDIGGRVVVHDVAKMPHLLVAGATGAGKSVCINTLIMSILYKADPDKVKFIMIDPKVVELSIYNDIPHMYIPVVTDPKKAAGALNWAVSEMMERYNKMAAMGGVKDIKSYNQKLETLPDSEDKPPFLPQIVIIVDELADLMMVAKNDVEDAVVRLTQLARAAGIHLVIATQRPSVDVITGLIKANMPSRIALAVSSGVDSRTIIDMNGAEKLLGRGDMLFYPSGYPKPVRVQGAFISEEEIINVVEMLKVQGKGASYNAEVEERINQMQKVEVTNTDTEDSGSMYDDYFAEAGKFVIEKDKGSISMLQRMFRIGFNRAARIMDQLEEAGVVGAEEGAKPRRVLMSMEEFEQFVDEYV